MMMSIAPRHSRPHHCNLSVASPDRAPGTRIQSFLCLLMISTLTPLLSSAGGSETVFRVARFLDEEMLETCNESILLADEDGNGEMDGSEYTTLIEVLTDGAISVDEIAELPLRLRTVYHMTACMCALQPGASSDCCVGDNSAIPIDDIESETPTMANRVFCGDVERGIAFVKEDMGLTPSPTAPPVVTPSTAPTTMTTTIGPTDDPSMILPTVSPSEAGTDAPLETLCIRFQYEILNNQFLSADDIMNEVDNSLKDGLIKATRTTVINILNETYPRSNGESSSAVSKSVEEYTSVEESMEFVGESMLPDGRFRKLLQAAEKADAVVLDMDLSVYHTEMHGDLASAINATRSSRRLHSVRNIGYHLRRSRRLVYYSDEFPVEIRQIADSTTCPESTTANDDVLRCTVVSSSACVVLEPGDDPAEIRRTNMEGLEEAFENGDFVANIPADAQGT